MITRKNIAILWAMVACMFIGMAMSYGQNMKFEIPSAGAGFDVQSGTDMGETIDILGVTYDIKETNSGSQYVILNNGSKEYPLWIGTETKESLNGQKVRQTKRGTYFIFAKGKGNRPYCKYLKVAN